MLITSDFRNSYFLRLMISYSIMTVFVTGLCGAFLYNKSNRIMLDEIWRDNHNRLSNIRSHIEASFFANLESVFLHKALETINPASTEDIQFFLNNGYESNNYRIYRFVNNLNSMVSSNPGTKNITFYFKNSGFVVDKNFFYSTPINSPSAGLLEQLPQLAPNQWFLHDNPDHTKSLSYIYSLPFNAVGDAVKGYLLVSIDMPYLKQMFDSMLNSPDERLYLYNGDGEWLAGSGNTVSEEAEQIAKHMQRGSSANMKLFEGEQSNTVISLLSDGNSVNQWTYAIVRPLHSFVLASQQLQKQIVSVCLLVLALGFLVSYLISRGSYSPVRKMIAKLGFTNGQALLPRRLNEFSMVDRKLTQLNDSISELRVQLDDNSLLNILNGQFIQFGVPKGFPTGSLFAVAAINLLQGTFDLWKKRIKGTIPPFRYDVIVKNASTICLLFYIPLNEQENWNSKLLSYLRGFQELNCDELTFSAGIGRLASSIDDIQSSNEQAAYAQQYCFLRGEQSITSYADIDKMSSSSIQVAYESLENRVRAGDETSVLQFLESYAEQVRKGQYTIEVIHLSLTEIKTTFSKVIIQMNANKDIFALSLLTFDYKQATFDKTIERLTDQGLQITRHVSQHIHNNVQADVIHRLKDYIDSHLDEDISLEVLSEQGGLSTQYISKLFKDVLHISFSDYITNARLEKSRLLLLEQTSLTVTDISSLVGYRNVQYFCKKFKQKYSITPVQYRNSIAAKRVEQGSK